MTERIRALLDEAAADVRPRVADPLPVVLCRGRHQRQRRIMAGGGAGLTAVVLLVAGFAAIRPAAPPRPAPAVSPTVRTVPPAGGPVTPRVVAGEVVAAGFTLPVPPGWQLVEGRDQAICETAPRTLFVNGSAIPGGPCQGMQPIITVHPLRPTYIQASVRASRGVRQQLVLPGGQPGWLENTTLDRVTGQGYRFLHLTLPWSGVTVSISGPGDEVRAVFDTIRTEPVTPTRLVVPEDVSEVGLQPPDEYPRPSRPVADPAVVGRVLALLAGLTEVVPADAACPSDQPVASLLLAGPDRQASRIVISTDGRCAEASSSLGGRVRLPATFLPELTALFETSGR